MTDKLSKEHRSWNMSQIRGKGMKPELVVRKLVHAMGFRYRLHRKDLPGKPDLVFPSLHKIIFVHGCFWHQHDDPGCRISRRPKSNKRYWTKKLKNNAKRDASNIQKLEEMGWEVFVCWECETKEPESLEKKLIAFLSE